MVRELPVLYTDGDLEDASHQAPLPPEPALCMDNIQGNSIVGFNKDFQTLVFFSIGSDVKEFEAWLATQITQIATASEVLQFNRLFKAVRSRRNVDSDTVAATWRNVLFSHSGLQKLDPIETAKFTDSSFDLGLAARSAALNDPQGADAPGSPQNWLFGGTANEPDGVFIFAGDNADAVSRAVRKFEDSLYEGGASFKPIAQIMYKQHGATLPAPNTGHEHFGFLDGVSQPGVRGTVSDAQIPILNSEPPAAFFDFLTLRQNPNDSGQGKPGQDVLFPGEFVLGYPGQDPKDVDAVGPPSQGGPVWSDDGSFVVIRRLRQDVPGFQQFLRDESKTRGLPPTTLGAKVVGRWASGSPVIVDDKNDPEIGNDDSINNFFEFHSTPSTGQAPSDSSQILTPAPAPAADPTGVKCPFGSHIRKVYPRDDITDGSPLPVESATQTHRMLRRGIPFGPPFDGSNATEDRGLLFIAYQSSILRQFEFVTQTWVNEVNFKENNVGIPSSGN